MKVIRKAVSVAIFLIVIGMIISIGALFSLGFNLTKLSNLSPITHTHMLEGEIRNVSVKGVESDIELFISEDGKVKVISKESDKVYHRVDIVGEELNIVRVDERQWYELIGATVDYDMKIEIYLPKANLDKLNIDSVSGNMLLPKTFSFNEVSIRNISGKIDFASNVSKSINIESVNGKIDIKNVSPKELGIKSTSADIDLKNIDSESVVEIRNISGKVSLDNINAQKISVESTSGKIKFNDVVTFENIEVESISGDIDIYNSDATALFLQSTSGNISGKFLTHKVFSIDTISGNVTLPQIQNGGLCEIKTISGNIQIEIAEKE